MCYPEPISGGAMIGDEQPPVNENLESPPQAFREVALPDLPSCSSPCLVNGNQPDQAGQHLRFSQCAVFHRGSECGVGMLCQSTGDAADAVVLLNSHGVATGEAVGELVKGEREQGKRVPAFGVGGQADQQFLFHLYSGIFRRLFDDKW